MAVRSGMPNVITSQTGAREFYAPNMTRYSMFVGGTNSTHHALENYSPLMNGFGRLFMVRPPLALLKIFSGGNDSYLYSPNNLFMQFKHIMEYMPRSINGFGDKTLENAGTAVQGGFAGRQFNTPTVTKEQTNQFTVGLYELVGSPVYTVLNQWANAIGDENSGLATYGGYISGGYSEKDHKPIRLYKRQGESDDGLEFNEANHTAEFIYVMHDRSGAQVERAVLLADCYPTSVPQGPVLNMEPGGVHDNATYEVTFNCTMYSSTIINKLADKLLKQYRIVSNCLNFNPELGDAMFGDGNASLLNRALGTIPTDSATGTNVGNVPVYNPTNAPEIKDAPEKSINRALLAGQPLDQPQDNWNGFASDKYNTQGYTGSATV